KLLPSREMNGQPSRNAPLKLASVPGIDSTLTAVDHDPSQPEAASPAAEAMPATTNSARTRVKTFIAAPFCLSCLRPMSQSTLEEGRCRYYGGGRRVGGGCLAVTRDDGLLDAGMA